MVTLSQLAHLLGEDLVSWDGEPPGPHTIHGVHISELNDPTPYLSGGELLLTTGIPFRDESVVLYDYVDRLIRRGVSALGLGLGAGLDEVPAILAETCSLLGLELLVVPAGTPFLKVSTAYWDAVGRESQADIALSLTNHVSIAQAATHPQALNAIVRTLAEAVDGWAAFLPSTSEAVSSWPPQEPSLVRRVRTETSRGHHAGAHSSGSFDLDGTTVVAFSINVGRSTAGFLAVGAGRPLRSYDRQLILSGCSMLALIATQEQRLLTAAAQLGAATAELLVLGHVEAARTLSHYPGMLPLPDQVRLLSLQNTDLDPSNEDALVDAISRLTPVISNLPQSLLWEAIRLSPLRYRRNDMVHVILDESLLTGQLTATPSVPSGLPNSLPSALPNSLPSAVPSALPSTGQVATGQSATGQSGALGTMVPLATLHLHAATVDSAARRASAGQLEVMDMSPPDEVVAWIEALAAYTKADLRLTVRAYLAHRGQWDRAAEELGIHRNTLRYRIAIAARLLDNDLDNPDVAAPLWLRLRDYPQPTNA